MASQTYRLRVNDWVVVMQEFAARKEYYETPGQIMSVSEKTVEVRWGTVWCFCDPEHLKVIEKE